MLTIENTQFVAMIAPLGAELTSLKRKADQRECIWQDAAGQYWPRHAPVLFPAIGRSNHDRYLLEQVAFSMKQHGFARDLPFTVLPQTRPDAVSLQLNADEATLRDYPFLFSLQLTYTLTDSGLQIDYLVQNYGDTKMPYALGYHPGFNLTQPLDHYELVLDGIQVPMTSLGIDPAPFRDGSVHVLQTAKQNHLPLSYPLLDDGLIIIDARQAQIALVQTLKGERLVQLNLADFPYLALWTPEHQQAPFLCVEPFAGLPDQYGAPVDWHQKMGNTRLPAGGTKRYVLTLRV